MEMMRIIIISAEETGSMMMIKVNVKVMKIKKKNQRRLSSSQVLVWMLYKRVIHGSIIINQYSTTCLKQRT